MAGFTSYAQNFEDVMLWRALGSIGRGFYIDVGACEPDSDSVTRAFYERGWSGINLEPAPAPFARLDAARPRDVNLRCAAGAQTAEADFLLVDGGNGLSTLRVEQAEVLRAGWPVETIRVAVRPLAEVCREQVRGQIHFLKIDAEGAERAVLEGADFAVFRPWIVVVEATEPNSTVSSHGEWEALLTGSGYRMAYADGLNRFYLAAEQERLSGAFAVPPNVFDGFVRAGEAMAREAAAALQGRVAQLEAQLAEAQRRAGEFAGQVGDHAARADAAEAEAAAAHVAVQSAAERAEAGQRDAAAAREAAARASELEREAVARAEASAAGAVARGEASGRNAALAEAALAVAQAERDHATQEMWESNRLASVLASDRQKLLDELGLAQRHHEATPPAMLGAIYASTSWRVTAPLRTVGRLLGRR